MIQKPRRSFQINNFAIAAGVCALIWTESGWQTAYLVLLVMSILLQGFFLLFPLVVEETPKRPVAKLPTTATSYLLVMLLVGYGNGKICLALSVAAAVVTWLLSRRLREVSLRLNENLERSESAQLS